ncbi:MAG TPA: trypsin-like serine protease, partial [Chloroflexi bacterium]|nr:trypsin-like serine protease [Chloroflexota bacterium]
MERSDRGVLVAFSDALADAVERAGEATVRVDARSRFAASGLAYADDLVLTADHVIERDEGIIVGRPDGTEVAADLVGRDPGSDLALLRLREGRLLPAEPVTDEARVGQFTLALGRPTAEGIQASLGIISVVGGPVRTRRGGLLERYIRTDAISYPGFSGGPLVDGEGRVVGINTSGLTMGASLAIPVAQAWQTARDLLDHGRVRRAYLGVRSQPVELAAAQ